MNPLFFKNHTTLLVAPTGTTTVDYWIAQKANQIVWPLVSLFCDHYVTLQSWHPEGSKDTGEGANISHPSIGHFFSTKWAVARANICKALL